MFVSALSFGWLCDNEQVILISVVMNNWPQWINPPYSIDYELYLHQKDHEGWEACPEAATACNFRPSQTELGEDLPHIFQDTI